MKLKDKILEEAKNNDILNRMVIERQKYIRQAFERQKFTPKDRRLIENFCNTLGYSLSFNKENKAAKVYNNETKRYGFLCKRNGELWYCYKPKEGNKIIFKRNIQETFKLFNFFMNVFNDAPKIPNFIKDFISATVGIIEIDPIIVSTENKLNACI